jgi:ADP-heptose:LPS heptosyltransferase
LRRIAIIHTGGLGDFLQILPVIDAMRQKWPEVTVSVIGRPEWTCVAEAAGLVDRTVSAETCGLHRLLAPSAGFDDVPEAVACAHLIITFLLQDDLVANLERWSAADVLCAESFPAGPRCNSSAAQFVYDQVAGPLGLPETIAVPRLSLPDDLAEHDDIVSQFPGVHRAAVLHPGSGSREKNWPLDRFRELAARLGDAGLAPVWLLGPAEAERDEFADAAGGDPCLSGASLRLAAALLASASVTVGNDSGITHLAAALGTPTVALFGPSDPAVWAPRGDHVAWLRAPGGAMAAIDVEDVLAQVAQCRNDRE